MCSHFQNVLWHITTGTIFFPCIFSHHCLCYQYCTIIIIYIIGKYTTTNLSRLLCLHCHWFDCNMFHATIWPSVSSIPTSITACLYTFPRNTFSDIRLANMFVWSVSSLRMWNLCSFSSVRRILMRYYFASALQCNLHESILYPLGFLFNPLLLEYIHAAENRQNCAKLGRGRGDGGRDGYCKD